MSFEASLIFGNVARGGPSDNSVTFTYYTMYFDHLQDRLNIVYMVLFL